MVELIKKENYFQMLSKSVKEVETETGKGLIVEGYASTKDKDRYGDIVKPEAFEKAMQTYALNPIVLLQHDADKPIGKVDAFTIDGNGLYIKAIISEDTDGVMNKIKNGVLKGFSIGYRLLDWEREYTEDEDGNITDTTNIIKELELLEISLVSIPANPYALRKSIGDCFNSKTIEMPEEEKIETPVVEEATEENVEEKEVEETEATVNENEQNENNDNGEAEEQGEDKVEEEVVEEEATEEAVEETEISPNENEEAEKTDEKPVTELKYVPEKKAFEVMRKEFNEILEKKDVELKAMSNKVESLEKKFAETVSVLGSIVNAMKGMHDTMEKTVVQSSYKLTDLPLIKDVSGDEISMAVKKIKEL